MLQYHSGEKYLLRSYCLHSCLLPFNHSQLSLMGESHAILITSSTDCTRTEMETDQVEFSMHKIFAMEVFFCLFEHSLAHCTEFCAIKLTK